MKGNTSVKWLLYEIVLLFSFFQVDVVKAKAEEWSGPMEPVDLILLNCMFGYIEHPHRFLDRCMDWLRPGGTIFISVLDEEHVFNHFGK